MNLKADDGFVFHSTSSPFKYGKLLTEKQFTVDFWFGFWDNVETARRIVSTIIGSIPKPKFAIMVINQRKVVKETPFWIQKTF